MGVGHPLDTVGLINIEKKISDAVTKNDVLATSNNPQHLTAFFFNQTNDKGFTMYWKV
jgi:hypothetical protein